MKTPQTRNRTNKTIAAEFEPEAKRIRAEAARQLTEIRTRNEPRKAPDMPNITDPTSRLLAHRIRKIRTASGWTLSDFAINISNVSAESWSPSNSQLSAVETCKRALSIPELNAIAEVFNTTPGDLMRKGALCELCGQELPQ
jgi:hypothetical protein